MPSIDLLQLCPLSDFLEGELRARYRVHRWFEMDEAGRDAFLAGAAHSVQAVATGGHIGVPGALMAALPALGIVAINGVGYDKVDLEESRRRNIRVTTTPGVLTDDVADLAVGLVISLLRDLPAADRFVRSGAWPMGDKPLARKVTGRRFGVFGLGHIGSAVAARLSAFGPVAYTSRTRKVVAHQYLPSLLDLARQSDVLVLAAASNADTRGVVDAAVLEALGPEGYLVNVSRGALVDESALIRALQSGRIAGAALDVYIDEPSVPSALRESGNTVLTPHIASATVETRVAMARAVLANLDAYFEGAELPGAIA